LANGANRILNYSRNPRLSVAALKKVGAFAKFRERRFFLML